jgi:hypothetical protein
MNRRIFFRFLAGAAAIPLIAKLPPVARVGAWAEVKIRAGAITSITITNAGSGYIAPFTADGMSEP